MRVLMVGPWRSNAMQRQILWAAEAGIELLVADFRRHDHVMLPAHVRRATLWPNRAHGIVQSRLLKKSTRSIQVGALRLQQIAGSFRPDVIHCFTLVNLYRDVCLQARLHPLLFSAWGSLNRLMESGSAKKEKHLLRLIRETADTLLVETPNLLRAVTALSVDPMRVECFPIGVDSALFHPGYQDKAAAWRFALQIPPDATVLLSPRGWAPNYGQQHIMRAFAEAIHRVDRPLVLVFLGVGRMKQPEKLAQDVHDLGVSLGVGHAIRWIPGMPYEEMPGVYALADIVVNYPRRDAFPSTLLEAAACARPVVTGDLPAYRNTYIERFCRLVEPENPEALADALVDMVLGGPAAWTPNVEQAREIVLSEYEENDQKNRLIALYHRIALENARR